MIAPAHLCIQAAKQACGPLMWWIEIGLPINPRMDREGFVFVYMTLILYYQSVKFMCIHVDIF